MDLKELRKQIDSLDEEILKLLNKRAETVLEVGKVKAKSNTNTYAPHREQAIINRLTEMNKGPFPNSALSAVYREIMSACRSLEKNISVAFLGPEATFTHIATIKHFGSSVNLKPMSNGTEVFREVETERADYGVIAIENSTEGAVNPTLDAFVRSNLKVCSEIYLPISQYLLSNTPLAEIKEVYSHAQGLAQCRSWLENNLKNARIVAASSTAEAVKRAGSEKGIAAIGSKLAADLYGVNILAEKIQDIPHNMTRFLVIGHHCSERTGNDKTFVLFSVRDEAGSLANALSILARHGLNLTNIQLRPSGMKAWEYLFFVDLEGHKDDEPVKGALEELEKVSILVKVIGSYPRADDNV